MEKKRTKWQWLFRTVKIEVNNAVNLIVKLEKENK
jgi:hypothetical protein